MSSLYDYGGVSLRPNAWSCEMVPSKSLRRLGNTHYDQDKLVTIPVPSCAL